MTAPSLKPQAQPLQIQCGQGCDKVIRLCIPNPDCEFTTCRICKRETWVEHVDQDAVAEFCRGVMWGDQRV